MVIYWFPMTGCRDAHANKIKMVGGLYLNGQSIFIRRPFALDTYNKFP